MAKKKIVSTSWSFDGWNFKDWFKGNWTTIKEGFKVGVPLLIGWVATGNPALTALITLGGKFLMDLGQYYWKEYTT